jgi:hypothetical protein
MWLTESHRPFASSVMESGQRYTLWYSITPSITGDGVNLATFSLRWKRYKRLLLSQFLLSFRL